MKTYNKTLALAASSMILAACGSGTNAFNKSYTGILGAIHLIAIIWAVVDILGSSKKSSGTKAIWIVVVVVAPFFGLLFYILAGREK